MEPDAVKRLIEAGLPDCDITVNGDGSHFDVTAVGDIFDGKSMLEQQKMIYATLGDRITNGDIHAINIKCYTPAQWATASKLKVD